VKRIGRSPDFASAIILALIDTPKMEDFTAGRNARREYDPFAPSTRARHDPFAVALG
jgi:hypothetical protein